MKPTFDRVLVCVDGSDYARRAATCGIELAKSYEARVDVVHVLDRPRRGSRGADETDERREQADEIVGEIETLAADRDISVDGHVLEGKPPSRIVEFAADRDVDLVVMGRRGRTGLQQRLLGSVTDKVLRNADVPVLVVTSGDEATDARSTYEDVLVPTDGSENAERALPYAATIASRHGSTVHVLTVVDLVREGGAFDAGGLDRSFVDRLEERGRENVDRSAERIRELDSGIPLQTDVLVQRDAADHGAHVGIHEYAESHDVDLIVLSSQGVSNFGGRILGSVADRVLRTVDVPVLVVPA